MKETNISNELRMAVFTSLFAALFIVGAYVSFNIGSIPFVLSNLFILMAGTLLGFKWGVISVLLYILLGAVGLPVFSRGGGGIAYIFGPTGGFILGFLFAVMLTGVISAVNNRPGKNKKKVLALIIDFTAMLAGLCTMYLTGIPWFAFKKGLTIIQVTGMFGIFILFDFIKIIIALLIIPFLRPLIRKQNN